MRSALWRLNGDRLRLLAADRHTLVLHKDVLVDVHLVTEWPSCLVAGTATAVDMVVPPLVVDAFELLPGWLDDWVLLERECLRQRVLHALEALSRSHSRARCHAQAVDAAMAAVAVEPLRESAQRTLMEAHLAEGNCVEARRCYEAYRELAYRELGVEPSSDLRAVVGPDGSRHGSSPYRRSASHLEQYPASPTAGIDNDRAKRWGRSSCSRSSSTTGATSRRNAWSQGRRARIVAGQRRASTHLAL